ncbi:MAG: lanthionine synthetase LanC family protein [Thermomicrobiales bacterium]
MTAPAHQGMTYSSLGPEPYGGSSGVALFLAEMAVATGDEKARETALGAIRQALGRAEVIEAPVQLGLYTGRPGLALVAARVGRLLQAEDIVSGARNLLDTLDADLTEDHEHDLLSGSAGAVIALLRLSEMLDEPALIDRATGLGERLVEAAECNERGCSWPSIALPDSPNLTGYSHGAAGIGMALLELWQATGDEPFHDVATRAFDFERSWFDPDECNWPDFRTVDDLDERPDGPFPYATFWCHGAPGIALSRLRAWELTGDDRYRDEAITALNTTQQAVINGLEDGTVNYSLCHGLAGNAEILALGSEMLGEGFERFGKLAGRSPRPGSGSTGRKSETGPVDAQRLDAESDAGVGRDRAVLPAVGGSCAAVDFAPRMRMLEQIRKQCPSRRSRKKTPFQGSIQDLWRFFDFAPLRSR